jgi:signal transduction histidine kinase
MENFKYSILYVDDEEINLRVFKSTFEDEFDVYTAISGAEGLKIFQDKKIDLIITDQRMPEMTGVEFLKHVLEHNPEPNRILLTGFSDIEALSSAVNDGKIYQYINKPWDESELKPVIYQALESYYLKRENQNLTQTLKEKNISLNQEVEEKNKALEQLHKSEKELRIAKEKAEESDRLKTSFLNNMSHEIRTPLNGIVGFAELVCEDDITLEDRKTFSRYISQNSRDLLNIIQNIVQLSKIESGMMKCIPVEVNCNEIFEQLYTEYKERFAQKGLKITFDCMLKEDEKDVVLDKEKTYEILQQLLDNALKFTEEGGVSLRGYIQDNQLHIIIKDSGIGISPEYHSLVFERFRKLEKNTQKLYRGNGIGLSIALGYTKMLDGTIDLVSEESKGSKFTLVLPLVSFKKASENFNRHITNAVKISNILIVEDEEDNAMLLKFLFKNTNAMLHLASDGQQAIDICSANPEIDLVLMDLRMPLIDGFEATKEIKKFRPELKIIAQSAYAFESDRRKAMEAGCDDFIIKPLNKAKLQKLIVLANK